MESVCDKLVFDGSSLVCRYVASVLFFELGEEIFDMGMLDVMGSEMVKRQAELSCLMILYYTVSAIDIAFDA